MADSKRDDTTAPKKKIGANTTRAPRSQRSQNIADFVDADGADNTPGTEDDNLRLLIGSPCLDAGDNTAVPADLADLDGDDDTSEPTPLDLDRAARFLDDTGSTDCPHVVPPDDCGTPPIVDMGAYEFPDTSVCD